MLLELISSTRTSPYLLPPNPRNSTLSHWPRPFPLGAATTLGLDDHPVASLSSSLSVHCLLSIHPSMHPLSQLSIHSPILLPMYPSHPPNHLSTQTSIINPPNHSPHHPSIYTYSLIHHSSIHLSIHSLTHPFIHLHHTLSSTCQALNPVQAYSKKRELPFVLIGGLVTWSRAQSWER